MSSRTRSESPVSPSAEPITLESDLIRLQRAGRTYGTGRAAVVAVYEATCAVRPGDRIAVTGPSGSGKSTVLHLLAGLESPSVGTVDWPAMRGRPADPSAIGLVFQAPTLIPALTVAENVRLPLLLADEPVDAQIAAERGSDALVSLGLGEFTEALPQQLSGGQAQRAVIARVLASRPQVVLADEPTSQLDRASADHVAALLVEVCDRIDAALVVATHDPAVAGRLRHVWPIKDGRLAHRTDGAG